MDGERLIELTALFTSGLLAGVFTATQHLAGKTAAAHNEFHKRFSAFQEFAQERATIVTNAAFELVRDRMTKPEFCSRMAAIAYEKFGAVMAFAESPKGADDVSKTGSQG